MVVVQVGDQHRVERARRARRAARPRAQVHDALAEERIGEDPDAVELEEHGRVADVLDPRHAFRRSLHDVNRRRATASSLAQARPCGRGSRRRALCPAGRRRCPRPGPSPCPCLSPARAGRCGRGCRRRALRPAGRCPAGASARASESASGRRGRRRSRRRRRVGGRVGRRRRVGVGRRRRIGRLRRGRGRGRGRGRVGVGVGGRRRSRCRRRSRGGRRARSGRRRLRRQRPGDRLRRRLGGRDADRCRRRRAGGLLPTHRRSSGRRLRRRSRPGRRRARRPHRSAGAALLRRRRHGDDDRGPADCGRARVDGPLHAARILERAVPEVARRDRRRNEREHANSRPGNAHLRSIVRFPDERQAGPRRPGQPCSFLPPWRGTAPRRRGGAAIRPPRPSPVARRRCLR